MEKKKVIKNKLPKIKYIYIEPKNEAEAKHQQEILSKAYGTLFDAVLEKKIRDLREKASE